MFEFLTTLVGFAFEPVWSGEHGTGRTDESHSVIFRDDPSSVDDDHDKLIGAKSWLWEKTILRSNPVLFQNFINILLQKVSIRLCRQMG